MPKGRTHVVFNMVLVLPLLLVGVFCFYTQDYISLALLSLSFFYATCFASPDMDLANQIKLFSLKGFLTLPFRIFYAPFVRHRSAISHTVLFGTLSRIVCVIVFLLVLSFLVAFLKELFFAEVSANELVGIWEQTLAGANKAGIKLIRMANDYRESFVCIVIGFVFADIAHIVLDKWRS